MCPPKSSVGAKRAIPNPDLKKRSITRGLSKFSMHLIICLDVRGKPQVLAAIEKEPLFHLYPVGICFFFMLCHPCLGFHDQHAPTWIWHSHTIALANKVQRQMQDYYNNCTLIISVEDLIDKISFKETNMLSPESTLTEWRMVVLCVTWGTPILKLMW